MAKKIKKSVISWFDRTLNICYSNINIYTFYCKTNRSCQFCLPLSKSSEAENNLTDYNATHPNLYIKKDSCLIFFLINFFKSTVKNNFKKCKRSLICFDKRRLHLFSVSRRIRRENISEIDKKVIFA